jgi:superfamily II DNA or RNA helicase
MTGDTVQIASVQTLVRRLGKIRIDPRLIIIDEAHHSRAGSWAEIIRHYPAANLLGVTATPVRLDGSGLGTATGGFFDCMVEGPTVAQLITMGYLARPIVYAPPIGADFAALHTRAGDYVQEELAAAVDKPTITGCAIDHYKRICPGVPAIAFCASVKHAEHVAQQFNDAGIPAASLDGTLLDGMRKARIQALKDGTIRVLTSCDIISEGTDIPVVTAAILLRRTLSLGLYLQQVGRCLRPHPGKTNSIILDHVGNTFMHGFPDDDRVWDLNAQRAKRGNREAEQKIVVRQCQTCFAVFRPPVSICPQCGAAYQTNARDLEQVSGELVKISRDEIMEQSKKKKIDERHADSLEQFLQIARDRGYNPSWAHIRWNLRQSRQRQAVAV